ncbi:hypothetical protein JW756_04085 [Candidatus Woesearchaeota archaeon]|nr:hypothetical protein [Candidatus Woesearchaeota archaeon]
MIAKNKLFLIMLATITILLMSATQISATDCSGHVLLTQDVYECCGLEGNSCDNPLIDPYCCQGFFCNAQGVCEDYEETPDDCKYFAPARGETCGGPGAHCGNPGDATHTADPACCQGYKCYYNICLAEVGLPCTRGHDCSGDCGGSGCYDNECCGTSNYPCNDDSACCEGFHCSSTRRICVSDDQPYCGDGFVNTASEQCELPGSTNNRNCCQSNSTCDGARLGTRDAFGSCDASCGCVGDPFNYACVIGQCGATCDSNDDCAPKCIGSVRYYGGACDLTSCACSYTTEDCNSYDGWIDTGNTRWISIGECTEKEQKERQYKDYSCAPGGCTYSLGDTTWIDTGNTRNKPDGTTCNDGLFCTNPDVCTDGICSGATRSCDDSLYCTIDSCDELNDQCSYSPRSCSAFNISQIATCDYNPDNYHYTWDFRAWFTSVCDEVSDQCTTGDNSISHVCADNDMYDTVPYGSGCDAECDENIDCSNSECSETYNDYCVGYKLKEYDTDKIMDSTTVTDSCTNTCNLGTCFCTDCSVSCGPPTTHTYCVLGICGATCDDNADCDDCNPHTTDICLADCTCQHITTPYCGDGFVNLTAGETCELPGTSDNSYCGQTTSECSGNKIGTRDGFGNCDASCGCTNDPFNYICILGQCGATCDSNDDCADYCDGDIKYAGRTCDLTTSCSCTGGSNFDCNSLDGWYDTGNTEWVSTGICTEKERKEQEQRDYSCTTETIVDCTYITTGTQWVDTGNTRNKPDGTVCDDGLWCTDNDVCTDGQCGGTSKDCSGFDITLIETCFNNPDGFHFTWDFRNEFTSVCDEDNDRCTTGNETITHTCDVVRCGALCTQDSDCFVKEASSYRCLEDCTCEVIMPTVQTTTHRSSGGGGGGGGSSGGAIIPTNWDCGEWSTCINSKQSRTCSLNGVTRVEKQDCIASTTPVVTSSPVTAPESGSGSGSQTETEEEASGEVKTFSINMGNEAPKATEPVVEKNDVTGFMAGAGTTLAGISINWYAVIILLLVIGCLPLFFHFVGKK